MAEKNETRRINVFINSELAGANIRQLTAEGRKLNNEIRNLTPGTKEFIEASKRLQLVNGRLNELKAQVKGVGLSFNSIKQQALGFVAGGGVLSLIQNLASGIKNFAIASFEAFKEEEQAIARLEQTIKSTGGAAGLTSKELRNLASALQSVTQFEDNAILSGEALLLTFTNIGKDVFPQATETMLDMSEALGQDVKQSAIQLGKALNDPITGLTALRRVGVSFSSDQVKVINQLQRTGDIAGAQKVILQELQKEFGGVARAAAQTASGGLKQLSNLWGDVMEKFGAFLGQGVTKFQPFLKGLVDIVGIVFDKFVFLKPAFSALSQAVTGLFDSVKSLIGQFGFSIDKSTAVGGAMRILTIPFQAATMSISLFVNVIRTSIDAMGLMVNQAKKAANFFGADFKIDPNFSFDKLKEDMKNFKNIVTAPFKEIEQQADSAMETAQKKVQTTTAVTLNYAELSLKELKALSAASDELAKQELERRNEVSKQIKQARDEFKKLQEDVKKLEQDALLRKLSDNDREIKSVELKYAELILRAKGHSEEIKKLEILRDEEISALRRSHQQKENEERIKVEDQIFLMLQTANDREIIEENQKWDELVLQAQKFGLDTTGLRQMQADAITQIVNKQHADEVKSAEDKNKKIIEDETKKNAAIKQLISDYGQVIVDIFKLVGSESSEFAEFQKAIVLAQIAVDTASAISSLVKMSEANPTNAVTFGAAGLGQFLAGLARIFANVAKAKELLSKAAVPEFASGGSTFAPGGAVNKPFLAMAGEKGPEWIAPNWMLQDPVYGDVIGLLESVRARGYASGGVTTTSTAAPSSEKGISSTLSGDMAAIIQNNTAAMNRLSTRLEQPIQGVWDWDYDQRTRSQMSQIEKAGSIS